MKFPLLFTASIFYFSTTAQVDSVALEKFYLQKADSLFERGEYEAARTYFWSAQDYSLPKPYSAKEAKEKANFYFEMNRKVDVAITYNLTDSIKYKYRMEEGNRWLTIYKDTPASISYFIEAQKIFPNKTEPMEHIKSALDLQHRKMDTIFISNNGPGRYLFIGKQPRYRYDDVTKRTIINGYQFRYPNYNLTSLQQDTVFCLKDSLPYNGVLISQGTNSADISGTQTNRYISLYHFKSGISVSQTEYQLCTTSSPKQSPNPLAHFIPLEQDEYICSIRINFENTLEETKYYSSGALAGKTYYGKDTHEAISYTQAGDTSGLSYQRYSADSNYLITSSKTFFETGQLKSFNYSKENIEGKELINEYFERDEKGDTLNYIRFNADDNTEISIRQYDDAAHLLRLCYRKGDSLVGIPTPRMLFLDENYHIISESAFVQNHNKRLQAGSSGSLFEAFPDLQNGKKQRYIFYAYPKSIDGKETRKHYERIRKIQLKLEQD